MSAATVAFLLGELKATRQRALDLATTFIYLDPHSDAPDAETTMFCSQCGCYGEPGKVFMHKPDCLVGQTLADCSKRPFSYIEYDLGPGLIREVTHEEAALSRAPEWLFVGIFPMSETAYMRDLGAWIATQRKGLGMKQSELAEAIGVSQGSIWGWENGKRNITAYSHAKLKAFFKQQKAVRGAEVSAK